MNEQLTVRQQVALALLASMLNADCIRHVHTSSIRRLTLVDEAFELADAFIEAEKVKDEPGTASS